MNTNAFTLRIDWGITAFAYHNKRIVLELAKLLAETLSDRPFSYSEKWEQKGFDYDYDYDQQHNEKHESEHERIPPVLKLFK